MNGDPNQKIVDLLNGMINVEAEQMLRDMGISLSQKVYADADVEDDMVEVYTLAELIKILFVDFASTQMFTMQDDGWRVGHKHNRYTVSDVYSVEWIER